MWTDELAKEIIKKKGDQIVVHTMITPSGPIHLGNLREVMVGYLISEALKKNNVDVSFHFLVDNFDHLRKVYPFLPKSYEKEVGKPISEIPAPEGKYTYDKYFLTPFLSALKKLNIRPKIFYVDELYKTGVYAPLIKESLKKHKEIAEILNKATGKKVDKDWSPLMPLCGSCGRLTETKIKGFDLERNLVFYECACGYKGESDISKGGGKLRWRIHWPATWKIFNVGVEGFGKDLATKGGAYDTGRIIIKKVFGGEPPFPIPYEWIYLKGKGRMASSTGLGFTPEEILKVIPPQLLIYYYQKHRPLKHLEFDPKKDIPILWNDYGGFSKIPFEHLLTTAQFFSNFNQVLDSLKRTGYKKEVETKRSAIKKDLGYIRNWIKNYIPQEERIKILDKMPSIKLTQKQKEFLSNILLLFDNKKINGAELHQEIHKIKEKIKIQPKEAFSAIYLAFLGKESGPKAGWFLAGLNREFVIKRLKEAIND